MNHTLTNEAAINAERQALLAVAPDAAGLEPLVANWSSLLDAAIIEIGQIIEQYQGANLRTLLDWVDALSDAYFDPSDWSSYEQYVMSMPTSVTVED